MQIKGLFTFLVILLFNVQYVKAEVASKGVGTIQMKSNNPTNIETESAKKNAVESAWKSFTAKFNTSKMKQYMLIKEDIDNNLSDYIISTEVIENIIDQGTKTLKTVVKIKINSVALDAKLSTLSAAGQTASGDNSGIVGIFITRELASRRVYDEKKVKIVATKDAASASESIGGSTDSIEKETFSKQESGGSATQKSDQLIYKKASNTISPDVIAETIGSLEKLKKRLVI